MYTPPSFREADRGEHGTLIAHMARANAHWRSFVPGQEVLAVFLGPHAYISSTWYVEPVAVPTWNYAAVRVYGVPRLVEDVDVLRQQVEQLVGQHEDHRNPAWKMAAAEPKMDALLKAIVGFEIPIARMEGKLKFNQNRSREDQEGVVRALEGGGGSDGAGGGGGDAHTSEVGGKSGRDAPRFAWSPRPSAETAWAPSGWGASPRTPGFSSPPMSIMHHKAPQVV